MPAITKQLLRKRAEHNEGLLVSLEEISLHQEEIERIDEILGMTCRHLKILYLQNNLIFKIENLIHLKELEYLNLALNNVFKIEGLQNCEFLKKLDLTVNFIDVDELEASINHLVPLDRLKDLYMMGNPAEANWSKCESYLIAKLPQLLTLDGKEITRSMQISARQKLDELEAELRKLAHIRKKEKLEKASSRSIEVIEDNNSDMKALKSTTGEAMTVEDMEVENQRLDEERNKMTENTPEARVEIYRELAQQKKEKEDRERANQPKERDFEREQSESIAAARRLESELGEGEIKQKNEGGWEFRWDEDSVKGMVTLEVSVAKFLDSSLIDVDIHPNYISIVIKSKVLRLRLPDEVKVSESKCQRSKTTGSLIVIMPKVNPKSSSVFISAKSQQSQRTSSSASTIRSGASVRKVGGVEKKLSIQELMIAEANTSTLLTSSQSDVNPMSVDFRNIVKHSE